MLKYGNGRQTKTLNVYCMTQSSSGTPSFSETLSFSATPERSAMAGRVQVDRRGSNAAVDRQLRPFVLNEVVSTEKTLGTGSYGSVLEVCSYDFRLCCWLRCHANGQLLWE